MNSDGSNQTDLTRDLWIHEGPPHWSPDGTKIAFNRSAQIYVMNPDGLNKLNLTNDPTFFATGPLWSPDGTKIAFRGHPRGSDGGFYVMNADGSEQTKIPNSPTSGSPLDWQPIPGPKRSDYKNAAKFCKAEQDFWGKQFASRYGGGKNAFGKCVSAK